MMKRHWDDTDETAYREAQAMARATADQLRKRASRIRFEELIPGLEALERRAAVLHGDVEFFEEVQAA